MISRLLALSVRAHWATIFLTAVVAAYGSYELTRLPLDALPDITNKQVMINFAAPALGPEDVASAKSWKTRCDASRNSRSSWEDRFFAMSGSPKH